MKHLLDTKTIATLIKTLVFSKLFYCSSVWSNTSKMNIDRLQEVQNFAARLVTDTRKFDNITPVLTQSNWLSVTNTLEFRDAIMTYKCLNGLAPTHLLEKFKKHHSCIILTQEVKIWFRFRFIAVLQVNVVSYTEL